MTTNMWENFWNWTKEHVKKYWATWFVILVVIAIVLPIALYAPAWFN